ncbi:MAG: molybdenum cofactor biosynthesis protein MoaE [Desulfatibacillaceae bacterium]
MAAEATTVEAPFDVAALLAKFNSRETHATGTVVIHHGKVKRPGKQVPEFTDVLLEPLVPDPGAALLEVARQVELEHGLHQIMIVHRIGVTGSGDDVLWVAVSAATRGKSFAGCAAAVDLVKEEHVIRLVERA